MLAIPSSVWKVCRFHYSLSRFTAAVAMFLHGGPRVRGELCGQASAAQGKGESGRGPPRHTHGLHVLLQRQSWTGQTAGSLLSLTGKQKRLYGRVWELDDWGMRGLLYASQQTDDHTDRQAFCRACLSVSSIYNRLCPFISYRATF